MNFDGLDLTPEELAWLKESEITIQEVHQSQEALQRVDQRNERKRSPLEEHNLAFESASQGKKIKPYDLDSNSFPTRKKTELEVSEGSPPQILPVFVGSIMVKAENIYLKGNAKQHQIQAGDLVEIYSSTPSSGTKKQKPSARIRTIDGKKEIGRIYRDPADSPSFLAALLDSSLVTLRAEILFLPALLKTLDEIYLEVKIHLLPKAFAVPSKREGTSDDDEVFDDALKKKKGMLVELFQRTEMLDSVKANASLAAHKRADGPDTKDFISPEDLTRIYGKSDAVGKNLKGMKPNDGMLLTLRDYQEVGLAFMYSKETSSALDCTGISPLWDEIVPGHGQSSFFFNPYSSELSNTAPKERPTLGGILADEMGLGKTIEVLALIHTNRPVLASVSSRRPKTKATLIVCPLNLISQWKDEALRSFEEGVVPVEIYYGGDRKSNSLSKTKSLIVITTYGTLVSEFQSGNKTGLYSCHWHRICLDEAHSIKEKTTKVAKACYAIEGTFRWCITGTPVINKLDDLYSLFKFLQCDPWHSYAFWNAYVITPFLKADPSALKTIQTILEPLIIRRTKDMKDENGKLVIPLPPKTISTEWLDFSSQERAIYTKLQSYSKEKALELERQGRADYIHIFSLLLRMRQMCNHQNLINLSGSDDSLKDILARDSFVQSQLQNDDCPICFESLKQSTNSILPCKHLFCRACIQDIVDRNEAELFCPVCRADWKEEDLLQLLLKEDDVCGDAQDENARTELTVTSLSTKLEYLSTSIKSLQKTNPDDKIIIFSQWTSFLDLIEPILPEGKFVRLDGKMSQAKREQSIKAFKQDPKVTVLIASLRSCGVGLNLTVANRIFLTDMWWNLATEFQAIDRVHRLGQEKAVHVVRLGIRDTIEEKIVQLQEKKQTLTNHVIDMAQEKDSASAKKTLETLMSLF